MNKTPTNIYGDVFAEVYHLYWTEFIDEIFDDLLEFMRTNGITGPILDLCCGTGRLAHRLAQQGFSVHGIDKSKAMIELAKRGEGKFWVDDVRFFSSDTTYELIISTFDAMNHLENTDDLLSVFTHVKQHLNVDGYFIFDLNTERGLRKWDFVDVEDNDLFSIIIYGKYVTSERRAYTRVTGFKKEGDLYRKFNEVMTNQVFQLDEVRKIIEKSGLQLIRFSKPGNLTKAIDNPEIIDRVMIIARLIE